MSTKVFIIRHGEIDNPQGILYGRNIPMQLSLQGREQIQMVSEKIKEAGFRIERIYSNPLPRAVESSRIISKAFGLSDKDTVVDEDLIDSDVPAIAGKPFSERDRIHSSGTDEYNEEFVALGNESRSSIIERMRRAFSKMVSENAGRSIAIVSHGDPIQFLLFKIKHPGEPVPPMNILASKDYPPKGSAERLTVDEDGKVLDTERIK